MQLICLYVIPLMRILSFFFNFNYITITMISNNVALVVYAYIIVYLFNHI